ncbi:uncharacterized protein B0I36DRAFT_402537 [Microdochium trichocladiopsis]|uniref:Uncharacterized protein n=1 Tax=Microdochium trichocladiopsis TaxID=1682393 RepID=A0A9P8YDU8_9PEZI|nr:uncharacterized protein B0I36DRAFT_402537 [Microdochium trichocladiopsis]KAH7037052.1 hypothetical protein B0I36DRAFT_402537 [Microdochium trichocladiopsis]
MGSTWDGAPAASPPLSPPMSPSMSIRRRPVAVPVPGPAGDRASPAPVAERSRPAFPDTDMPTQDAIHGALRCECSTIDAFEQVLLNMHRDTGAVILNEPPRFSKCATWLDHGRPVPQPEMLFTDRFGITMNGLSQTHQCEAVGEHLIYEGHHAEMGGYNARLASHGITYQDYRNFVAGFLAIVQAGDLWNWFRQQDMKTYCHDVTSNLRARGVPVVIKYKYRNRGHKDGDDFSIRHHPLQLPLRGVRPS